MTQHQKARDKSDTQANQTFKELPKVHTTYANVIKSLIPSRDSQASQLPKSVYEVLHLVIDRSNLAEYRKVCGFMKDGRVPATYFAVLSQTLQMNMMAKPDFPFAMLGLIHIYNSVTQHRPIYDTEAVHLTVRLDNLQPHDKGQQFDFITQVFIENELVWEGVSTYLSRQKMPKVIRESSPKTNKEAMDKLTPVAEGINDSIEVLEDIGRRYAFVSGDFNLIHLHPLSARAFGYPKAIAHGMWSKAKVLSCLRLPNRYTCEVYFKSPIFLPSTVELIAVPTESAGGWQFGVYAQKEDRVHLLGSVTELKAVQQPSGDFASSQ